MRTFTIHSRSYFPICNTGLSTIPYIIMLYLISLWLTHFISRNLYLLIPYTIKFRLRHFMIRGWLTFTFFCRLQGSSGIVVTISQASNNLKRVDGSWCVQVHSRWGRVVSNDATTIKYMVLGSGRGKKMHIVRNNPIAWEIYNWPRLLTTTKTEHEWEFLDLSRKKWYLNTKKNLHRARTINK